MLLPCPLITFMVCKALTEHTPLPLLRAPWLSHWGGGGRAEEDTLPGAHLLSTKASAGDGRGDREPELPGECPWVLASAQAPGSSGELSEEGGQGQLWELTGTVPACSGDPAGLLPVGADSSTDAETGTVSTARLETSPPTGTVTGRQALPERAELSHRDTETPSVSHLGHQEVT